MTVGVSEIEGQEARYTTPIHYTLCVCLRSCHSFLIFHWNIDGAHSSSSNLSSLLLFWKVPDHTMFWNLPSSSFLFIISFICLSVSDYELYSS